MVVNRNRRVAGVLKLLLWCVRPSLFDEVTIHPYFDVTSASSGWIRTSPRNCRTASPLNICLWVGKRPWASPSRKAFSGHLSSSYSVHLLDLGDHSHSLVSCILMLCLENFYMFFERWTCIVKSVAPALKLRTSHVSQHLAHLFIRRARRARPKRGTSSPYLESAPQLPVTWQQIPTEPTAFPAEHGSFYFS